jgi:hypothetical protein
MELKPYAIAAYAGKKFQRFILRNRNYFLFVYVSPDDPTNPLIPPLFEPVNGRAARTVRQQDPLDPLAGKKNRKGHYLHM